LKVGVLALQGGVSEHVSMLRSTGAEAACVRMPADLAGLSALVLPGGESTAMMGLLERWGLCGPIRELAASGMPIWGTCAGAILIADEVAEADHEISQPSLALARVRVVRNAFGRQVRSFQQPLDIAGLGAPFPGVFIRAPLLEPTAPDVEVLASVPEGPVFLRQGCIWLSSFHPELTRDPRVHDLFLSSAHEALEA
jgi:5'-phosphate synthase pdxT subunit